MQDINKNNNGPKIKPWGVLHLIFARLVTSLLYIAYDFRDNF